MVAPAFTLGDLVAAEPEVSGLMVFLFTGSPDLSTPTAFDDLVEPTYPGYARQLGDIWGDAYVIDAGVVARNAEAVAFECTGSAAGQIVTGYGVAAWDGAGMVVLDAQYLPDPIAMDAAGKRLAIDVEVSTWDAAAYDF